MAARYADLSLVVDKMEDSARLILSRSTKESFSKKDENRMPSPKPRGRLRFQKMNEDQQVGFAR